MKPSEGSRKKRKQKVVKELAEEDTQEAPVDSSTVPREALSSAEEKKHTLPNLCDPSKGQLFPNFDKMEDWEEFEDVRKNQIVSRFRQETENRHKFISQLN